jgi:hypothetical protein
MVKEKYKIFKIDERLTLRYEKKMMRVGQKKGWIGVNPIKVRAYQIS